MKSNALWILHVDGSCSKYGVGASIALVDPRGECHAVEFYLQFSCTNNMAEYEALVLGLRFALKHGVKNV